jgi:hypothetical protein
MMAEMAIALPLVLAGEKGSFHLPTVDEVRTQLISRAGTEADWPFSVDDGVLSCVWGGGRKLVMFTERKPVNFNDDDTFIPRTVAVTTEPFQLTVGNVVNASLFKPSANVEERIRLIAPFENMGQQLCNQPAGAHIGNGEL